MQVGGGRNWPGLSNSLIVELPCFTKPLTLQPVQETTVTAVHQMRSACPSSLQDYASFVLQSNVAMCEFPLLMLQDLMANAIMYTLHHNHQTLTYNTTSLILQHHRYHRRGCAPSTPQCKCRHLSLYLFSSACCQNFCLIVFRAICYPRKRSVFSKIVLLVHTKQHTYSHWPCR